MIFISFSGLSFAGYVQTHGAKKNSENPPAKQTVTALEDHLLSWITPDAPPAVLEFAAKRLPHEAIARIKDDELRKKVCALAFR